MINCLTKRRNLVRELVLNIGSLTEILALYVAYSLGADKWERGLLLLLACILLNNFLSRGWLWLLKN